MVDYIIFGIIDIAWHERVAPVPSFINLNCNVTKRYKTLKNFYIKKRCVQWCAYQELKKIKPKGKGASYGK